MHAPRRLQFAVIERLHAQADAIESRRNPGARFFMGDGFRVSFQGHFGQLVSGWCRRLYERQVFAQRSENPCERGRLQQARCAAAKVHRVHGRVLKCKNFAAGRREVFNFPAYSFCVRPIFLARHHARVKIAVGALDLAERHLNVNAQVHLGAATTSKSSDFACCTAFPSLNASQ